MNKKLIVAGAALAIVACFALTAFDKKTRAQQQMEIQDQVKMQLDQVRMQEDDKCTERVNMEAQTRFAQAKAEAVAEAAKTGKKPVIKRVPKGGGTHVDPLPQGGTKTDPQSTRGGAVKQGDTEKQQERSGASKPQDVEQQQRRGGAVKQGGGN